MAAGGQFLFVDIMIGEELESVLLFHLLDHAPLLPVVHTEEFPRPLQQLRPIMYNWTYTGTILLAVLRIRIRIRIRMFLTLLDPDPDSHPDPLVGGMDPRIRIRIHTKMSWIRNTAYLLLIPYW